MSIPCASATSGQAGSGSVFLPDYAGTAFFKTAAATVGYFFGVGSVAWGWNNTAAIASLLLAPGDGSNLVTGSRFTLYGLN